MGPGSRRSRTSWKGMICFSGQDGRAAFYQREQEVIFSPSEVDQNFISKKGKIIIKAEDNDVIFVSVVKDNLTPEIDDMTPIPVIVTQVDEMNTLGYQVQQFACAGDDGPAGQHGGRVGPSDRSAQE